MLVPTVTDDRDWSSKAAVTVWALKGLTQVTKTRLSLFALLALLLLLENLVTWDLQEALFWATSSQDSDGMSHFFSPTLSVSL